MATKAKTPARPWTKNGKTAAAKKAAPKAGMQVMSGREATAKAAEDQAIARRKASAAASRAVRNAAPVIMPAPAGHPAAKPSPAAAGAAAAKADDKARAALTKAGKPLPPELTGLPAKGTKAPAKAEKAPKPLSARAQVQADAEKGKLPSAPNWEKRTHYKAQHAALVELATKGDLKGLQGFEMPAAMTQLNRYRDLCIIALKAKGAQPARIATARRR